MDNSLSVYTEKPFELDRSNQDCQSQPDNNNDAPLQLSKITLNEEYRKKWKVRMNDFVCLTRNGILVNESLYRVGGLGTANIGGLKYFILIKHVEAYYDDKIMKMLDEHHATDDERRHLESRWCIIDNNGVEKVIFDTFKTPYLVDNSCLYSLDGKYYNIETGESYGYSSTSMKSDEYVFLDNQFDSDVTKRGVLKINKKDGSWELFPKKK